MQEVRCIVADHPELAGLPLEHTYPAHVHVLQQKNGPEQQQKQQRATNPGGGGSHWTTDSYRGAGGCYSGLTHSIVTCLEVWVHSFFLYHPHATLL